MVAVSQIVLACENFKESAVANLKQFWRSQEFTDVTLVSSDGFKLEAHKTVLSSSSSFFRDILIGNQHPCMVLYMRGVTRKELELLLELTYTGECKVEASELDSLLRTGKELGFQGLLENTVGDQVSRMIEKSKLIDNHCKEALPTELNEERNITSDLQAGFDEGPPFNTKLPLPVLDSKMFDKLIEDSAGQKQKRSNSTFDEGPDIDIELPVDNKPEHMTMLAETLEDTFDRNPRKTDENEDVKTKWKCTDCPMSYSHQQSMKNHMLKAHGTEVFCKICDFKTFSKYSLHRHENTVGHLQSRLRYNCDQCPFQSPNLFTVKRHEKIAHDGLRYQCDQCHNIYTESRNLVNHVKAKHGGAVLQCEYCDHEAKTKHLLKKHISTMKKYNEEAHASV